MIPAGFGLDFGLILGGFGWIWGGFDLDSVWMWLWLDSSFHSLGFGVDLVGVRLDLNGFGLILA